MAGHSHSANIAHRKGLVDSKRGSCSPSCAAPSTWRRAPAEATRPRTCGFAMRSTRRARSASPRTTSSAPSRRATGELGAENFEEVVYEGYGPGGVAVLCEALTDNATGPPASCAGRSRPPVETSAPAAASAICSTSRVCSSSIRSTSLRTADGSRARGRRRRRRADRWLLRGDLRPEALRGRPQDARGSAGPTESAETSYIPTTSVDLDVEIGKKMLKLKDLLEENDDVQNVYANDKHPRGGHGLLTVWSWFLSP